MPFQGFYAQGRGCQAHAHKSQVRFGLGPKIFHVGRKCVPFGSAGGAGQNLAIGRKCLTAQWLGFDYHFA